MDCSLSEISSCHLTRYVTKADNGKCVVMGENVDIISERSGLHLKATDSICTHHLAIFTLCYTNNLHVNRNCCDPFAKHRALVSRNLRFIDEPMKSNLLLLGKQCHVDQKICKNCIQHIKAGLENLEECVLIDEAYTPDIAEHGEDIEATVSNLNNSLSTITSPIKLGKITKLSKRRRIDYIEAKAERVKDGFKAAMGDTMGIIDANSSTTVSDPLDELLEEVKVKLRVSSRREQVRLLTLIPPTWPREKVAQDFHVSERQVREARELRQTVGILAEVPQSKKGNKPVDPEVVAAVTAFYKESDFVRTMPGAKQVVSCRLPDGTKVYEPQRLILCDLTEMYSHFCNEYPNMSTKIKRSKFCELRPKYCKTVSSSGTHSVCVCVIHQNFRFLVEKIPTIKHYREIIEMLVCDQTSSACMLRKCDRCPGRAAVEKRLSELFEENNFDSDDTLSYSQWTTIDRSNIITQTKTVSELIDVLVRQVDELTAHQYIKEQQSSFFKNLKENLPADEVIVQMDFAENYAFIVQDASQSFHWNNLQATLHPIVVYYVSNDKTLAHISYVYISDYNTHSHIAVYTMLRDFLPRLLQILPRKINLVHYFTDGCAGQYKSFKAFVNLMFHEADFGIPAKWHYFATSHGKSACDGVGAVVKYQARRASLQRDSTDFITTAQDLLAFAKEHTKIQILWYDEADVLKHQQSQEDRFAAWGVTVNGSRSHHCFERRGNDLIARRTSTGEVSIVKHYAFVNPLTSSTPSILVTITDIHPGEHIAFMYIGHREPEWYIGAVQVVDSEECDIYVNSLHPKGPASIFKYPQRVDEVYVPIDHVLMKVELKTTSHRQYTISQPVQDAIATRYHMHNQNYVLELLPCTPCSKYFH